MGDAYNEHHCRYRILAHSLRKDTESFKWIERCRCGRLINVEQCWEPYVVDEKGMKPAQRKMKCTKHWFHPDGSLWRITPSNEQT
jgi:hypothetical protein